MFEILSLAFIAVNETSNYFENNLMYTLIAAGVFALVYFGSLYLYSKKTIEGLGPMIWSPAIIFFVLGNIALFSARMANKSPAPTPLNVMIYGGVAGLLIVIIFKYVVTRKKKEPLMMRPGTY